MLVQGLTSYEIDSLSIEDKLLLMRLHGAGVIGFMSDGVRDYRILSRLETIMHVIMSMLGVKKDFRQTFKESLPELDLCYDLSSINKKGEGSGSGGGFSALPLSEFRKRLKDDGE